jgi:hypothetical protein
VGSGSIFGVVIDRRCRVRSASSGERALQRRADDDAGTTGDEAALPFDDEGFLDAAAAAASGRESLTPGAVVTQEVAAWARGLVLLGEPGAGKSTFFARLTQRGGLDGVDHGEVVQVDGEELIDRGAFESLVGARLAALPHTVASGADGDDSRSAPADVLAALTLIIDQIDKSQALDKLPVLLRESLRDRDTRRLRIMISCRTADFPAALTGVVADACGGCTLADLVPLTRAEAVELAGSVAGVDGEAFVSAAVAAGAGGLAGVPLTLGVLARTYRDTGSLDGEPAWLFSRAVEALVDEPDPNRPLTPTRTSVSQRVTAAGRLAALLLLSGRYAVSRRRFADNPHELHLEDVLSADPLASAGDADGVTLQALEEVVGTALFTGRGADRFGFVHSSLAAYLCAWYLHQRRVPREQVERLMLVTGGDGTRSVPVALREAAAWLVALNPTDTGWLLAVDPEGLVHYAAVIASPDARSAIVAALLDRAAEVELGSLRWTHRLHQLSHPGLDDQLLPVLESAGQATRADWAAEARLHLAVRFAADAATPRLAESLLALACDDDRQVVLRQQAAQAALKLDPSAAGPRLVRLLSQFADATYAARVDPTDDLRGLLLRILWPDHLSLPGVLPLLTHRRRHRYLGLYHMFQRTFPTALAEADVATVLEWAGRQLSGTDSQVQAAPALDSVGHTVELVPEDEPLGPLDAELLDAIVGRALQGPGATDRAPAVAELLLVRINRDRHPPPVPAPLDLQDQHGNEPPECRDLRRTLALELIAQTTVGESPHSRDPVMLVYFWSSAGGLRYPLSSPLLDGGRLQWANTDRLLRPSDFPWLYSQISEQAARGDIRLAEALAKVAATLFDLTDPEARSLANSDRDHPVWPLVAHWFQPTPPSSAPAPPQPQRRAGTRRRDRPSQEEMRRQLNRLLVQAAGGDTDSFWQLVWNLQLDPSTGGGSVVFDDNLLEFPGVAMLDGDATDHLVEAATRYVAAEHDHADTWLGTNTFDRRAWAGYLALALLERRRLLEGMPGEMWRSWAGVLVWFPAGNINPETGDVKAALLKRAVDAASDRICQVVRIYVVGELNRGDRPIEVNVVDPVWHPALADTWAELLGNLAESLTTRPGDVGAPAAEPVPDQAAATPSPVAPEAVPEDSHVRVLEVWLDMLLALHRAEPARAVAIARSFLDIRPQADSSRRRRAAWAARALLLVDASSHWQEVHTIATGDPELGREIAYTGAADDQGTPDGFNEYQLAEVYRWLSGLFPPEADPVGTGLRFGGTEAGARNWRDATLRLLAERGTAEAEASLATLRDEHPDRPQILFHLVLTRNTARASAWSPPKPRQLGELLHDPTRRLVRSDRELVDLLVATLREIEKDLPAHGELLWDRIRRGLFDNATDLWLPKPEAALSAYLSHELKQRLERRRITVNREVLVRPTNAYGAGDRTDITIEAPAWLDRADRVAAVIEVKGAWNDGLDTDQRRQLAERYLPATPASAGIYLMSWHPPDLWTCTEDDRRRKVARLDPDTLLAERTQQAADIERELGVRTVPILLRIPRPTSENSSS